MPLLTVVTGGIGSGKSVVCRVLRALGYHVYDCDVHSRQLMDRSDDIKRQVVGAFGAECIAADGTINRPMLASKVFGDTQALQRLNHIVHHAVRHDLRRWCAKYPEDTPLFVETAIAHGSGIARMASCVWEVTAPESLRIERVKARSGLTEEQVRQRIAAQASEQPLTNPSTHQLINDNVQPLLPQILKLLNTDG